MANEPTESQKPQYVPMNWENGEPATVRCSKCGFRGGVIPLTMRRLWIVDHWGPLHVTDYLIPEKWSMIEIKSHTKSMSEYDIETVYACGNCTIDVG